MSRYVSEKAVMDPPFAPLVSRSGASRQGKPSSYPEHMKWVGRIGLLSGAVGVGYVLLVRGDVAPNLRIGRRTRPLGPLTRHVEAPPETVFSVIAGPYLDRTPRALSDKVKVLERGADMVLAEHYTKAKFGLTTTTLETVRFERPNKVFFRLARGPVPSVEETFELLPSQSGTEFRYTGTLTTDLWQAGAWWGDNVATIWERTVQQSIESIAAEAERRAASG